MHVTGDWVYNIQKVVKAWKLPKLEFKWPDIAV